MLLRGPSWPVTSVRLVGSAGGAGKLEHSERKSSCVSRVHVIIIIIIVYAIAMSSCVLRLLENKCQVKQ